MENIIIVLSECAPQMDKTRSKQSKCSPIKRFALNWCFLLFFLSSCQVSFKPASAADSGTPPVDSTTEDVAIVVPTIAPFFVQRTSTATLRPSETPPYPTETALFEKQPETNYKTVTIFSNGLDPDWEILQNTEVKVQQTGRPNTYEGRSALEVTPLQDFGELIFTLKPDAKNIYLKSHVVALVFWISGGPNYIDTDEIGNTILGSNDYPYWKAGDQSAWLGQDSPFSETRLYYLGLNNAIPPKTWAKAVNWLDDRQYDPDYKYITGFYIKNDEGFLNTYYIDEISFLMIND